MDDLSIFVSNGTCYSSSGDKLDVSFIPCGNDAFGHQTCCGAGDYCMADNACFGVHGSGYGSFLTYMAGCTDPDYNDGRCPDKYGIDQPWIALTLCDNSDGEWAPCSQNGDPITLKPGSFCSCTDAAKTTVVFTGANSLAQLASLPQSTGQRVAFQAGYSPSGNPTEPAFADPASTRNSTSPTGGSEVTVGRPYPSSGNPTITRTGSNAPSHGSGIPTGAASTRLPTSGPGFESQSSSNASSSGIATDTKIGIGIGITAAVLLLIALIVLICLRRRKCKRIDTPAVETVDTQQHNGKVSSEHLATPRIAEIAGQPVSEADGRAANPWNVRSELEDTNSFSMAKMKAHGRENDATPQYVAYRPPPSPLLQKQNVLAELPAVKNFLE